MGLLCSLLLTGIWMGMDWYIVEGYWCQYLSMSQYYFNLFIKTRSSIAPPFQYQIILGGSLRMVIKTSSTQGWDSKILHGNNCQHRKKSIIELSFIISLYKCTHHRTNLAQWERTLDRDNLGSKLRVPVSHVKGCLLPACSGWANR